MAKRTSDVDRFWTKVEPEPMSGCWLWTGGLSNRGYAVHWANGGGGSRGGKNVRGYRYAFELLVGPVLSGMELDHLCRNRACVNPDHLEPVTHAENMGRVPPKTHCPQGHAYDEANTMVNGLGRKFCRTCHYKRSERWHAEHPEYWSEYYRRRSA